MDDANDDDDVNNDDGDDGDDMGKDDSDDDDSDSKQCDSILKTIRTNIFFDRVPKGIEYF